MAGKYGSETEVTVERSRMQIEQVLKRYGATAFSYATMPGRARIQFICDGRGVQFDLPIPNELDDEFRLDHRCNERPVAARQKKHEQACRARWRALLLTIQARLEAVECGIESFDVAFLAHLMLPNGQTVKDHVLPAIAANKMPDVALLGAP